MARSLEFDATPARGGAVLVELLRAMRPRQWIKNTWVFAAIAFSEARLWTQPSKVLLVLATFVLFCLAAGAIYLINDVVDIEKDRAHPKKRTRPLASGRLRPNIAVATSVVLMVIVLAGTYLLDSSDGSGSSYDLALVLISYILIQGLLYTFWLKNIVIVDIFTIAAGFLLRAVAGAVAIDIPISAWLLTCMGLLALFLGLGKRRAELVLLEDGATEHRRILDDYSVPMLDQMIAIVTSATIIAYTLFTTTATTLPHTPYPVMMVTVPFVVYGIFRYVYLIHQHGGGGSPEELLLKDKPLAIDVVLYALMV
ncbi:MAG TPA: decaprenyl-phosphate phosphoribosyltransferase, partial [Roseiflexaceae bacterium]|nr:decaprenyl-phosphate phosphoribosyltransferase [Roseiflexaceae bacterium]